MNSYANMKKSVILLLVLFSNVMLQAQSLNISSRVLSRGDSIPVEFATVKLMQSDSIMVGSTLTDMKGLFSFNTALKEGMFLSISSVGCKSTDVSLPCDTVIYIESTNELPEIVVRGSKKYVKGTPRGLQVSMAGNPIAKLGNAMDAIKHMPMIDASSSRISVLGHGTPVIYVNNRVVRSTSELSTLASEDISNVEIITNPSSKYGADVTSVILIRTKKLKDGFHAVASGNVSASEEWSESATLAFGQKIAGKVIDANGNPISYVNTVLLNKQDSSFIRGTVTDIDGLFSIPISKKDGWFINFSSIGYKSSTISSENIAVDKIGNLIISLKEDIFTLDGVTITGTLPTTQLKGNTLVTHVANSALSKLGTAKKILSKIPGIIEQNGNIEVVGKGTPLIYINGKKIRNEDELYQLSADNIKDIEVITNPGAKYGSEVNAVVRLITRKSNKGFGISLRADNEFSRYYSGGQQLDVNFRKDKFELFGMANFIEDKKRTTINSEQITNVSEVWTLDNSNKILGRNNDYVGKIGFACMPNDKHSFGISYLYAKTKDKEDLTNNSNVYQDGHEYDKWESIGSLMENTNPRHEVNAYYNATLGKFNIDLNADYLYSETNSASNQKEKSLNLENRTISTSYNKRNKLFAEKLTTSYPFKIGELSLGEEYTLTERFNQFTNQEGILNSSVNRIKEMNMSLFVEQSFHLGKVAVDLGMRYEHIESDYMADVNSQNKKYDNIFPSLALSAPLGATRISLGYNMKTTRPTYSQLDGNVSYINRFHYLTGNPLLQPVKQSNVTATVAYKWFYFMANFTHSKDEIIYFSQPLDSDPKISMVSYKNFDKLDKLTLYCSLSHKFSFWKPTMNIGYIQQWFKTDYMNGVKSFNKPIILLQLYNTVELPHDILLGLDASFQGKGNNQNMLLNNQFRMDFSINKSFFRNKLNIRLEANDFLGTYKFRPSLYNANMIINQENINDTRNLLISISYKINTVKSKYKGKGAGNTEKNRL